jgi:hypothetical protein
MWNFISKITTYYIYGRDRLYSYLEWGGNFSYWNTSDSKYVHIHFNNAKRIFPLLFIVIAVTTLLMAPFTKLPIEEIFFGFLVVIPVLLLMNRRHITITKYTDGRIKHVKQWMFLRRTLLLQPTSNPHIIARQRRWVGNRQFDDMYELILAYSDENGFEHIISWVFDDRKFFFQWARNNIRGVLREEEITEIAKELDLPFSTDYL